MKLYLLFHCVVFENHANCLPQQNATDTARLTTLTWDILYFCFYLSVTWRTFGLSCLAFLFNIFFRIWFFVIWYFCLVFNVYTKRFKLRLNEISYWLFGNWRWFNSVWYTEVTQAVKGNWIYNNENDIKSEFPLWKAY